MRGQLACCVLAREIASRQSRRDILIQFQNLDTMPLDPDNPRHARVSAAQGLLYTLSPRAVCDEIRLNWWAAEQLHAAGWLSFDPAVVAELDEAQEAELRFVGALVVAGCDARMLERLLAPLTKPYCYRLSQMYYDWSAQAWRLLPVIEAPDPEAIFDQWLGSLKEASNVDQLHAMKADVEAALDSLARAS
jgi:hypothetical protein